MNDSIGIVAGIITFVVMVLIYLWASLALSAVFRKAGEDAWQGWVPILNTAVLLRLGGFSPWFVFIAFVPFFGSIALLVMLVISYSRINRAFGHGTGMTVLAVLLPLIWATILGFGSSRWIGSEHAGPVRSREGYQVPDAAGRPLVGDFPAFDQSSEAPAPVGPAAAHGPASTGTPSPAPASSSTAAGFWAPPPAPASSPAPASAATSAPPAQIVVPQSAPAAPPLPPPPPVAFTPSTPFEASAAASPVGAVPSAPRSASPLDDDVEDSAVDPEDRIAPSAPLSGSFLPPPPPRESEAPRRSPEPFAPIESVPVIAPTPAAEAAASAPVIEVPAPAAPAAEPEPWAPAPLRTPAPAANDPEHFPELSEAVSAVAGAPDAGAPRSARSSVSALYAQPEIPDEDEDDIEAMDQTIVARRRRVPWTLIPPGGSPVDISSEVVILGRRPSPDPARPGAQLISISDETRTVSKTHARLELRGETWFVTDLGSTNGVLFATLMGTEVEAQPGQELEAGERFFLGDAEVRLKRSDA